MLNLIRAAILAALAFFQTRRQLAAEIDGRIFFSGGRFAAAYDVGRGDARK